MPRWCTMQTIYDIRRDNLRRLGLPIAWMDREQEAGGLHLN